MDIERQNILNETLRGLKEHLNTYVSAIKVIYNYSDNTKEETLIYENTIHNLKEIKEEIEKIYKKYIGEN